MSSSHRGPADGCGARFGTVFGMRTKLAATLLPLSLAGCPLALCIAEGTKVLTPLGEVGIETLTVGSAVFSFDLVTSELAPSLVTFVRAAERECVSLQVAGSELLCTSDHPLYDPVAGCFADAGDWVLGKRTSLLFRSTEGGVIHRVVTTTSVYAGIRRVFDISVNGEHHNFFASGILVHNKSECDDDSICGGTDFSSTSTGGDTDTDTDISSTDGTSTSSTGGETVTSGTTTSGSESSGSSGSSSGSGSGSSSSGSGTTSG